MAYFLFLVITLAAFWLLLSGFWDHGQLLVLGAISVLGAAWFGNRIERADPRSYSLTMLIHMPGFWVWLAGEVIKANIDVVKCIWRPRAYPISPTIARLRCSQQTRLGKAVYANSITLTPGTVAIEVSDGEILVHGLTRASVEELARGEMDRRVTRTERLRR